jgi:hypothetical protein
MRVSRIIAIVFLVSAGLVVAFESLLGSFQPMYQSTLIITTFDADGTAHERVVENYETEGRLYVSANHWPRAWYRQALDNPDVQVTIDGETGDYRAIPVTGEEGERVEAAHPHDITFRILTGFPPRRVVRLDPR